MIIVGVVDCCGRGGVGLVFLALIESSFPSFIYIFCVNLYFLSSGEGWRGDRLRRGHDTTLLFVMYLSFFLYVHYLRCCVYHVFTGGLGRGVSAYTYRSYYVRSYMCVQWCAVMLCCVLLCCVVLLFVNG